MNTLSLPSSGVRFLQHSSSSVAVPLMHEQHGLLVFNCGGPSFIMKREKLEEDIAPRLLLMVNNIKTEVVNLMQ